MMQEDIHGSHFNNIYNEIYYVTIHISIINEIKHAILQMNRLEHAEMRKQELGAHTKFLFVYTVSEKLLPRRHTCKFATISVIPDNARPHLLN